MVNRGLSDHGFAVCQDCGAAMPGEDSSALIEPRSKRLIGRPYRSKYAPPCKHIGTINVDLGYDFVTDMLVLEFALDKEKINVSKGDTLWLNRAAQSLSEALRLAACKELNVEFSELITGHRVRRNPSGVFVDIYLYDNLSSGAGYAVSVASEINTLLDRTEKLLERCDCESACHNCLKHYRNQFMHGNLDRFAALDLLRWGTRGSLAGSIPLKMQESFIAPLRNILDSSGYAISFEPAGIFVSSQARKKEIIIYPAMWTTPPNNGNIYISDILLKIARPYAVRKIMEAFNK